MQPKYLSLDERRLQQLSAAAAQVLSSCTLCPRRCRVNRTTAQRGFCQAGVTAEVSHWQVHLGEEPPLAEAGGAGAIFFAHCTLACVFCQNYQISRSSGAATSARDLAAMMLSLQRQGAQNIDLVSPTQYVPQIIAAVQIARRQGLRLPLVYNTNGYETAQTLGLLEHIVDIYLPDIKYGDDKLGQRYSAVNDYGQYAWPALRDMVRQTGPLQIDGRGRALRGVIVRHLVLPQDQAATAAMLAMLARHSPQHIGVSLMSQYAPCYQAQQYPEIRRPLQAEEYSAAVAQAEALNAAYFWTQELASNACYFPDFERPRVFGEHGTEGKT